MVSFAYQDPKIGAGFQSLASVFAPNANAMNVVKAQVLGAQRDNYVAESVQRQAQTDMIHNQTNSTQAFQAFLASNPDLSTPQNRAQLASYSAGMVGGLEHGPQADVGFTTFVQPNAMPANDLSNALLGTGVVKQYQDTPQGFTVGQQNTTDRANSANQNHLDVANIGADARVTAAETAAQGKVDAANAKADQATKLAAISPGLRNNLMNGLIMRIADQNGITDPRNVAIPANTKASLESILANDYAESKNADTAINDAYAQAPQASRTDSSWNPFSARAVALPDTIIQQQPRQAASTAVSAVPAQAQIDAAGQQAQQVVQSVGQQPSAAPAAAPQVATPRTAVNPKTGQVVVFQNGQWVDQKTGAPVQQ